MTSIRHFYSEHERVKKALKSVGISIDTPIWDRALQRQEIRFQSPQATKWVTALKQIQTLPKKGRITLDKDIVAFHSNSPFTDTQKNTLHSSLFNLKPWRKGPYQIDNIHIDSEWRCEKKWNRLKHALPDLKDKKVCDIGCNSGYFLYRLASFKPKLVFGIDPASIYFYQFHAINHFINDAHVQYAAIGFQDLDALIGKFDCITCMGILYHHQTPTQILSDIYMRLEQNGYLLLETLINPGSNTSINIQDTPKKRYAGMKNVYELPCESKLLNDLERCGFKNIQVVNVTTTTPNEQRHTDWSSPVSLSAFLDPNDQCKTIEGLAAPCRILITATK